MDPPSQVNEDNEMTPEQEEEAASLLFGEATPPIRLKESAGDKSCCIFKIPHSYGRDNYTAFVPKIVSIGPYHHSEDEDEENERLKMIQEHKKRYLESFLSKTRKKGVKLSHLVKVVSRMEDEIRAAYSEKLDLSSEELTKLMILDGCFVLMLFLVYSKKIEHTNFNDPIFQLRWILPTLQSDLLLLENQVPLSLLNNILETSKLAPSTSLNQLAFQFFNHSMKKPEAFWDIHNDFKAKHLLDLIRKTFMPIRSPPTTQKQHCCIDIFCGPDQETSLINTCLSKIFRSKKSTGAKKPPPPRFPPAQTESAKKLLRRGIQFKRRENVDNPLDISFKSGLLEVPVLLFDDSMSSFLMNCVAFEQFHMRGSSGITSYVCFMGGLINTEEDVELLFEKGIIHNHLVTNEQICLFFKNIRKDIVFSVHQSYLSELLDQVTKYASKGYHVHWAELMHTYFQSPWTIISPSAGFVLLILTILQVFYAAYAYYYPLKND